MESLAATALTDGFGWQYEPFLRVPADSTQVIEHTWQLYGAVSDKRVQIGRPASFRLVGAWI
jgi:hypothetical protein